MNEKLKHTEYFQGSLNKRNYFEGWYYKLVSKDGNYRVAIIPGVSLTKKESHTFIQIFVSNHRNDTLETDYIAYPMDLFKEEKPFRLSIEKNRFSLSEIDLSLKQSLNIEGKIQITDILPIEKSLYAPNIMGPFGYLNFMECYHGVISMNSNIIGSLNIQGELVDFTGGKAYIEKDWGKSFPNWYIWIESNHFDEADTSFMFSYANIPFGWFNFNGLIAVFYHNNKEYRFATYNRSKIVLESLENTIHYRVKKGKWVLDVEAIEEKHISLISPKNGQMNHTIKEGLSGQVKIKLYKDNVLIYEGTGLHAGIEKMK